MVGEMHLSGYAERFELCGFGNVLKEKLTGKEICFPLKQIKNNWVAEFVDSEGNHIEITAPAE